MFSNAVELQRAFDGLSIAKSQTFVQLTQRGRLRFGGAACDAVDDCSSRLVSESVGSRLSQLVVWPDSAERRAALAFAAAVVSDSVVGMKADLTRRRILHVGSDSSVREQLGAVKVGSTALDGVFAREYGRGDGQLSRSGPESSLPIVTTIVSPAEPDRILKALRPKWVAVDCGKGRVPPWLSKLLLAAKANGVPVIGWTASHLTPVIDAWRASGGGVYRWPRASGSADRFGSLGDLDRVASTTELKPLVLGGARPQTIAHLLSEAYQHLAKHAGRPHSQVGHDALAVAWRYLRTLESLPVPIDLYEAECGSYWGMQPLGRLKATLERFVQALSGDGALREDLSASFERLTTADAALREGGEAPLWEAAARLAVEAKTPTRMVFRGRAHRDLFKFALLSKYNISLSDLQSVGVSLAALSECTRHEAQFTDAKPILIGLPTKSSEWQLESLLDHRELDALVWPHLEDVLAKRASTWGLQLRGGSDGPSPLRISASANGTSPRIRVSATRTIDIGQERSGEGAANGTTQQTLWKRPDAAEAIRALFASQDVGDELDDDLVPIASDVPKVVDASGSEPDEWLEVALRVVLDDGAQILLPLDDYVNVVVRTSDGVNVVPRYSRALRVGDDLLLVHGDHRRTLYDLLVSRVHSHKAIAPWLSLIDRWHQDLRGAFIAAKRRSGLTFESLLRELQRQGSGITTSASVRGWIVGVTLAPSDHQDIRRLGEVLDVGLAKQYSREIAKAAGRLAGLHRSLANRLNRWLESEDAGTAALSGNQTVVDAELGLTIDDFRHSLVRGRVSSIAQVQGPFLRSHIGHLRRAAP